MANEAQGLVTADREARAAALDTTRSFIVQAPAGSGKTELLIQRYLKLLAIVDEPEEVLAITFTRKAAAEMRLRVVAALESARAGTRVEGSHQALTAQAAQSVLARDAQLDWDLAANPARMRILTLDALNASIARMLPLSSGSGGSATVIEDGELGRVYRRAAAATLDWLVEQGDNGRAVREVLTHLDSSTGTYVEHLARMLASRDQWLPFVRSGRISDDEARDLRDDAERRLRAWVRQALESTRNALPAHRAGELSSLAAYAGANLRRDPANPAALVAFVDDPTLPSADPVELPRWLALADLLLTRKNELRRKIDRGLGFPPADQGQKAAFRKLLSELGEHPDFLDTLVALRGLPRPAYDEEQWALLLSLFRVLPVATYELRRVFLARGICDHIEVALSAASALGTPDNPGNVALLLDYRLRHILVDEMQDTSRAQYRLLETLTAGWEPGDGRTLFCVGDPMQSVYGFRNAEVMQFLKARAAGIGGLPLVPLVLRQNFRSGEHLVDWFNGTFPRVLPAVDAPLDGAISYSASVAAPGLLGLGECVIHPGFGPGTEDEARRGAAVVQDIRSHNPDETLAVLVRSRTQLPALLRQLRRLGIRYQSVDIDRLTDLPEVIDLLALSRALVHRGDRIAWLAVLRAPWIGLDWADLHALVLNAGDATVFELLHDRDRLAALSQRGRAALEHALPVIKTAQEAGMAESLAARVERCWYQLGGPALLADGDAVDNAYHYLRTLARLEVAGTLPDLADLNEQLDAERVSSSAPAAVQVMTMHKAKGLQFDHVVLYAIGRQSAGDRPSIMSWIDLPDAGDGETRLIAAMGRRDEDDRDPLHCFIENTAAQKAAHEDGRLLYVACTRARKSLHIVGQVRLRHHGERYADPPRGSLLRLLWPVVEADFARAFAARHPAPDGDGGSVFAMPQLRCFEQAWEPPAVRLPPGCQGIRLDGPDELRVEYDWVGFAARLAGTAVHRWLQRLVIPAGTAPHTLPQGFEPVTRRWLSELGASEAMHDAVMARVRVAIETVLRDERGRWLLGGRGSAELALTGIAGDRVQSVIVDRIRIDDDGTHWIVDYKTSTHEGGDLEGFLRAESERYRPQLARYAEIYANYARAPVRCALYFPMLARFVEVDAASTA